MQLFSTTNNLDRSALLRPLKKRSPDIIGVRGLRVSPSFRGFGSRLRVFQQSLIDYDEEYLPATFKIVKRAILYG
jgi:hypothetical protein